MLGSKILRSLFRKSSLERELQDELQHDMAQRTADHERAGLSPEAAKRQANLELGGVTQVNEACRDVRPGAFLETIFQDVRYALRAMRKNLTFSVVAILTLALGFGASAAIFSVVNHLLLKPLPYPGAERLVAVWLDLPASNLTRYNSSGPAFLEMKQTFTSMEALAGIYDREGTITGAEDPLNVEVGYVTSNFFSVLHVTPLRGRGFEASEQTPGIPVAIILSEGLWRSRYGADPAIIGRTITFNGADVSVVGVMPTSFALPSSSGSSAAARNDVWVPTTQVMAEDRPNYYYIRVIGRLKPGVSLEQAQADADTVARHLCEINSIWADEEMQMSLFPLKADSVHTYRSALLALMGAVGVVLLLACSNIANLILARASDRRREFAMRTALGASVGRLVQLLVCESLLLFLVSGVIGMVFAYFGVELLWAIRPAGLNSFDTIPLNLSVFLYCFGLCFICGVICGLLPLVESRRADLTGSLRGGSRLVRNAAGSRYRQALLVTEVAGGLVLLIVSALFINSLARLREADPGFRRESVLTFRVNLPVSKYPDDASLVRVADELHQSLSELPTLTVVGASNYVPLGGGNSSCSYATPEAPDLDANPPNADYRCVGPGYLEAIGATLVEGRFFNEFDHAEAERVVIVDDLLVKRSWGDVSGLDRKIHFPSIENGKLIRRWGRIVGVIKNMRHVDLKTVSQEQLYFPYAQQTETSLTFAARMAPGSGDPLEQIEAIRARVFEIDPHMPLSRVQTMDDYVDLSLTSARFTALLLTIFSGIALLLASIGLFGVLAYHVRQRTRELGIRMALGASPRRLWRQVVRHGLGLTGLGVLIGLPIALGVTRFISGLLYGVSPSDPLTYFVISILFVGVAFLACLVPARRAMKVDPMTALRCE